MKTLLSAAVAALLSVSTAYADWAPKGPIKVLIGFQAGGGADTMARLIAEDLNTEYGWSVLPENITGAGGAVMARQLKASPADGLTIGLGITDTFAYGMLASRDPGYALDDFTFLATLAGTQMGIVAKSERGWTTMSDVIEAAKSGTKISFGSMTPRLADGAYYIGKVNGVDFNVVSSYKGGKDVLNAVNAADIDVGWVAGPQAAGVIAGDLVNLANGEDQPLRASPDAQMLKDIGVDFFFGATFVAVASSGIPEDAKTALGDAIAAVVQKDGSKSNAFINKAFALKVKIGSEAQDYVARELSDAQALLEATAN